MNQKRIDPKDLKLSDVVQNPDLYFGHEIEVERRLTPLIKEMRQTPMRIARPPRTVYKYSSSSGAKYIIARSSIWYTLAPGLDDVFEETFSANDIYSELSEFTGGPGLWIDFSEPPEIIDKIYEVLKYRLARRIDGEIICADNIIMRMSNDPEFTYIYRNVGFQQNPAACSFASRISDEDLWARYGDSSRGIAFGLDTSHPYFITNQRNPEESGFFAPISYWKLEPYDHAYRRPSEKFFIKRPGWEHQSEWRRIEYGTKEQFDKDHHLTVQLPLSAITEIVFGARFTESDRNDFIEYCSKHIDLKGVSIFQVRKRFEGLCMSSIREATTGNNDFSGSFNFGLKPI